MKPNEAPKKIQVHLIENEDYWSIEGYSFLEDKQMWMTEYTRTDAFIKKAVLYIQQNWIWNTRMIEDFRNYMKGE